MKRRNKQDESCNENWKDTDSYIIEQIIASVGCVLPHWEKNSTFPICTGKKIRKTTQLLRSLKNYLQPCQSIEKALYVYEESVGLDSLTELETIDGASKSYFKTRDDTKFPRRYLYGSYTIPCVRWAKLDWECWRICWTFSRSRPSTATFSSRWCNQSWS